MSSGCLWRGRGYVRGHLWAVVVCGGDGVMLGATCGQWLFVEGMGLC